MDTHTLKSASAEANRRYAATGLERDLRRAQSIAHAYDRRRHTERERAYRDARHAALKADVDHQLARPMPARMHRVGLVSVKRAKHLMGLPALCGGWIAVEHMKAASDYLDPSGYGPACLFGADILLPGDDPVCDVERGIDPALLAGQLRSDARAWAQRGEEDLARDALDLLNLIEREG